MLLQQQLAPFGLQAVAFDLELLQGVQVSPTAHREAETAKAHRG